MRQVRGPAIRGISQRTGDQIEGGALGGRVDLRDDSGREYRTSQGKRKLKAVMHLSRIAVSVHRPVGMAEPVHSPWKKTKIFPTFLQKVKGSSKDSNYAKLMSVRPVDGDESMIIKGSYFQKSADDEPSTTRKLNQVLKSISASKKLEKHLTHEKRRSSESETRSEISIHVTAESQSEDSDVSEHEKKRKKKKIKLAVPGDEGEDKDYLKVTLDQDETNESTVDSDEEYESSSSESSESGSDQDEPEDESSEGSEEEGEESSEEDDTESQTSSMPSSYSRSKHRRRASELSTGSISTEGTMTSSHMSEEIPSEVSSNGSVSHRKYKKSSGSNHKKKRATAGSEVEDTIKEVSEEDEQSNLEQGVSDREESIGKNESTENSVVSKVLRGKKSTVSTSSKMDVSQDSDVQSSDSNMKGRNKRKKKSSGHSEIQSDEEPDTAESETGGDSTSF